MHVYAGIPSVPVAYLVTLPPPGPRLRSDPGGTAGACGCYRMGTWAGWALGLGLFLSDVSVFYPSFCFLMFSALDEAHG